MIDLNSESSLSLSQAARLLPPGRGGRPVTLSCLLRWVLTGVRSPSGDLVRLDPFQPYRISTRRDGPQQWERLVFYRDHTGKRRRTFREIAALYTHENHGFRPSRSWPLMPKDDYDFYLPVARVPVERLRGDPELLDKLRRHRETQEARRQAPAHSDSRAQAEAELFV
jgi:hypothetical protein